MKEFKVTFETNENHELYGKIKCRRETRIIAVDKQEMKRILREKYPNLAAIKYYKDISVWAAIHK